MDHFAYCNGELHCESAAIHAVTERHGTPTYVYSRRTLLDHYGRIERAFASLSPTICYSVKCCSNLAILRLLRERGAAFDVVSGGELVRALEVGADPGRIVFAGVGKTDDEIRRALECEIGHFNVESEAELGNLAAIAESSGQVARVALRVNPDVDPHTHQYTTTGKRETKFGVDLAQVPRLFDESRARAGLALTGIHLHLGSPVNRIDPYVESLQKVLVLIDQLRQRGHAIEAINIGGGFGAHYDADEAPPAADYAERIVPLLEDRGLEVFIEPGRSIAANAGVLITRVLYTKTSGRRHFVIVDAAMTDLIRPALYGSFHFAWPVRPRNGLVPPSRSRTLQLEGTQLVDIVGPVCESGDFLAKDRRLPPLERGDRLCIFSAGAYGMSMSSQYNSRPRAAEVLVSGHDLQLIRRRETYEDLVSPERPERL